MVLFIAHPLLVSSQPCSFPPGLTFPHLTLNYQGPRAQTPALFLLQLLWTPLTDAQTFTEHLRADRFQTPSSALSPDLPLVNACGMHPTHLSIAWAALCVGSTSSHLQFCAYPWPKPEHCIDNNYFIYRLTSSEPQFHQGRGLSCFAHFCPVYLSAWLRKDLSRTHWGGFAFFQTPHP